MTQFKLQPQNFTNDHLMVFLTDYFESMYNEQIKYKNIGKLAKTKNVDIMFLSNFQLMQSFGIKCNPISYINRFETKYSYLIITDKNKVINKMYKDVTDNDIICILNNM